MIMEQLCFIYIRGMSNFPTVILSRTWTHVFYPTIIQNITHVNVIFSKIFHSIRQLFLNKILKLFWRDINRKDYFFYNFK